MFVEAGLLSSWFFFLSVPRTLPTADTYWDTANYPCSKLVICSIVLYIYDVVWYSHKRCAPPFSVTWLARPPPPFWLSWVPYLTLWAVSSSWSLYVWLVSALLGWDPGVVEVMVSCAGCSVRWVGAECNKVFLVIFK